MRTACALLMCAIGLGGCSVVESLASGGEGGVDPSAIYIASFDRIDTTRDEVDQFKCLSGAPIVCDMLAISLVECWCPY